jgi:hypothetical protein
MRKLITTIALLTLVDSGGDCADRWFAKSSRTSIDELGLAIAAGGTGGAPPAAC